MLERMLGVLGVLVFLGLTYLLSSNRRAVDFRTVFVGLGIQVGLALIVLKTQIGQSFFGFVGDLVNKFLEFTNEGSELIFGSQIIVEKKLGIVFAFHVLPSVIFISAFFTFLYHYGILQAIVKAMAWAMMRLMRVSGAESLSSAANVFMGQTEAPIIVKPYIAKMTRSELACLMLSGMATISGGIMAAYISMGIEAQALLTASVMAAPGAIVIAKILVPETEDPLTRGVVRIDVEKTSVNFVDALAQGASDGMKLCLNIAAMLIAFLAMVALMDGLLSLIDPDLTLSRIFSWIFAPVAYLLGISSVDSSQVASLLGTKLVLTEFVAYANLLSLEGENALSPRSTMIVTFALCGFANIGSVGIQLGGIGAMAPSRRGDLAKLSFRALYGGFVASLLNAAIAGILMD